MEVLGLSPPHARSLGRVVGALLDRPLARAGLVAAGLLAATGGTALAYRSAGWSRVVVRIDGFVLFVAMYGVYVFITYRLFSKPLEEDPNFEPASRPLAMEVLGLNGVGLSVGSLGVLAHFFSLAVLVLLLIASQIAILAPVGVFRCYPGREGSVHRARWQRQEMLSGHPVLMATSVVAMVLLSVAYPIWVTVIYFSHPLPSQELTIWIFRATLICNYLGATAALLPMQIAELTTEIVDDDNRFRATLRQFGALFSHAIYIGIAFWAFGLGSSTGPVAHFSVWLAVVLLVYLVGAVIVPALVGSARWHRRRQALLASEHAWLEELREALDASSLPLTRLRLAHVRAGVEAAAARCRGVTPLLDADLDRLPPSVRTSAEYIEEHDDDDRLRHLRGLTLISRIAEEADPSSGPAATGGAPVWSEGVRLRRREIQRELQDRGARFPKWLRAGALLAPAATLVLSQVSGWMGNRIVDALPF